MGLLSNIEVEHQIDKAAEEHNDSLRDFLVRELEYLEEILEYIEHGCNNQFIKGLVKDILETPSLTKRIKIIEVVSDEISRSTAEDWERRDDRAGTCRALRDLLDHYKSYVSEVKKAA